MFLFVERNHAKGFIKILDSKKLYKNEGNGCLKQFNAPAIIDFFMLPDNDLLDDEVEAKDVFNFALNHLGRIASRCCYFNISSTLLLFLKINFSNEVNDFEKLLEDS